MESDIANDEIDEHDYKSICQGIVNALKNTSIIRDTNKHYPTYYFLLISENEIIDFINDVKQKTNYIKYLDDYINDFQPYIIDFIGEFSDADLHFSSDIPCDICVDMYYECLVEYQKIKKNIKEYFNVNSFLEYSKEMDIDNDIRNNRI